ncbi:MAG TPA: nucleoside phosphorylase [Candidatus Parabacteroides intestinipullorum]|uniref:Uridine phosphorylase n=1 Tax=Candidatus Parabacteroides intestinipullorum TaxID=2838723 RepID=A0A9D1X6R5_9BACT|nr:nucleoside phosphorylase [Candidatus Parabacteroides intestinipullorum]
MATRIIPPSELVINEDGSAFHLHLRPGQLADRVILVGDPNRVTMIGTYLDKRELEVQSREFHTITGYYQGKRVSIVSHGIGCDNIDIVLTELDALANIDFQSRTVRPEFHQLSLVRIGTSGSLQADIPVGSYVVAQKSIGLDGVIYFYDGNERVRDLELEEALLRQLDWRIEGVRPYVVSADLSLVEQIAGNDFVRGMTMAANGFYGPQGRYLRLPLMDPALNGKIERFCFREARVTNYEMESSALAGLAALMGHRAMTVCCIIAGRVSKQMNTDYKDTMPDLIQKVLERI